MTLAPALHFSVMIEDKKQAAGKKTAFGWVVCLCAATTAAQVDWFTNLTDAVTFRFPTVPPPPSPGSAGGG